MTGADLITDIRKDLLEPVAGFWTDAELLTWINRAELDLSNRVRGFDRIATVTTVAGTPDYPLPSNWIGAKALFFNEPQSDGTEDWHRLNPTSLEKVAQEHPNFLAVNSDARDVPQEYWIWDHSIYLYPPPKDSGRTVKMFFRGKPVPLAATTDSINVDDSLSDTVKHYVKWNAWMKEKELDLADFEREAYFEGVGQARKFYKYQATDMRHRIDVVSGIPFSGGFGSASHLNEPPLLF